jgi:D-glycero-D-manno-heptose 1,7-bisphosphate phosphatase
VEGIAQLNRAGFWVVVVTNQRCIAKGLITEAELRELHQKMREALAHAGATIDAVYYCPHEVEAPCLCRKPAPGMLFDAARSHGLDLAASWMIGDSEIDVEAGKSAGCKTIRLVSKKPTGSAKALLTGADEVASSLIEAAQKILSNVGIEEEPRA